jgi:hypothetical protein
LISGNPYLQLSCSLWLSSISGVPDI